MRRGSEVAILMFAAVVSLNWAAGWAAAEDVAGQGVAGAEVVPFGHVRPGSYHIRSGSGDDGWRRTASGWEHIDHWPEFASLAGELERSGAWHIVTAADAERVALVPGWRLDFHPAVLALVMVGLLLVLACCAADSPDAEVV